MSTAELGGGMTAGFLAGATGIVLGILALIAIASVALLSVAAIVFGRCDGGRMTPQQVSA
jgi:hypothetical protein